MNRFFPLTLPVFFNQSIKALECCSRQVIYHHKKKKITCEAMGCKSLGGFLFCCDSCTCWIFLCITHMDFLPDWGFAPMEKSYSRRQQC